MKPPAFALRRAYSVDECLDALAASGGEAVQVIAGGQSLMPLLALRMAAPDVLIDIGRVAELDRVRVTDDVVEIGALVRHVRLLTDPAVRAVPLLPLAARHIGHVAIRNRGTLGGSLAHADPAAELPAIALLHDAELVCASRARGRRAVPAADFFLGPYLTAMAEDELLLAVRMRPPDPATRHGFVEFSPREGDYARAGAACALRVDGQDRVMEVRAVLFAVGSTAVDVSAAFAPALGEKAGRVDWAVLADTAVTGPAASDSAGGHGAAVVVTKSARAHLARVALRRAFGQAYSAQPVPGATGSTTGRIHEE